MNPKLKIVLLGLASSAVMRGFVYALNAYVIPNFSDWIFSLSGNYLLLELSEIDYLLLVIFPLVFSVILVLSTMWKKTPYLKLMIYTFISLNAMLIVGAFIGVLTWTSGKAASPLLPKSIKYQPFEFYWTLFILLGTVIPFLIFTKKVKSREIS